MAHVGFVSAAYWGDVMPFVPIADELAARGHRVTFAVPEGFHAVLGAHAFDLVHLGTDFSPRELAAHGDLMERANTIRGMKDAIDLWIKQLSIDPAHDIVDVLDGVAPDVWMCHNTVAWLVELSARPAGVPMVVGHLFPMMIPSGQQPPPTMPLPSGAPAAVNRLAWRIGRSMMARLSYDDETNALRAERGLEPAHANVGFGWERADAILALVSPRYWQPPDDWPAEVSCTGFTVWGDAGDPLPDDLGAYLEAGAPPVVVTLGTSAATNARDAFVLAAEAIEAAGHRPLLLVGNQRNLEALAGREDAWVFAPLSAVLARSCAIVHAAGHGTTAAALAAGVPQVVLPQVFDQVWHARRLASHGVGVTVPWKRRSAQRIAAAVRVATRTPYVERAQAFARELEHDDGVAAAVATIERTHAAHADRRP